MPLERRGWIVDYALSYGHAMGRLSRASYDFVVIDLTLPDSLGSDAWREIRQAHPRLRGIITTHSSSLRAYVNPMGPGALAFLLKPLDIPSVIAIIDQSLVPAGMFAPALSKPRVPIELYDEWLYRFYAYWNFDAISRIVQTQLDYYFTQLQVYQQRIPSFPRPRLPTSLSLRPVLLASLLVLLLFLGSLGTMAVAAQAALPGAVLYPVKTMVESLEMAVTLDAAGRAQLHLLFASHRIDEVQGLIALGRADLVPSTIVASEEEIKQATTELERAAAQSPAMAAALASQLAEGLAHHAQLLAALHESAPESIKSDLESALRLAELSMAMVQLHVTRVTPGAGPLSNYTSTPTLELSRIQTLTATLEPTQTSTPEASETLGLTETTQPFATLLATETPLFTDTPQLAAIVESTTPLPTEPSERQRNTPGATDTGQPTEPPEPGQATHTPEPGQVTDTPEPGRQTDTPQPPQPTDTPEPVVPTDTPQPPQPTDTPKPVVPTDTPQPPQPTGTAQPTSSPQPNATTKPTNTPQADRTPAPTKTKQHPPPSPPPPTHKPTKTPKPEKTKPPHASIADQGDQEVGAIAYANAGYKQVPGQDHDLPVATVNLADELRALLGFVTAQINGFLDFLRLLLSSP